MAILTFTYQFSPALTEPPTGSQLRMNADILTGVEKIWVRYVTTDGMDAYYALLASAAGWTLWVQDKDDHTRGARYHQTGPPLDKGGYVELPVVIDVDNAPLVAQQVVLGLSSPADSGTTPTPPPGSTLVTLQEGKDHLRLTTPAGDPGDADLALKLAAAEATIVDYLKGGDATAWAGDAIVRAAVLLQFGALYRWRGDDPETLAARASEGYQGEQGYLSPVITALLQRKRDPTLV